MTQSASTILPNFAQDTAKYLQQFQAIQTQAKEVNERQQDIHKSANDLQTNLNTDSKPDNPIPPSVKSSILTPQQIAATANAAPLPEDDDDDELKAMESQLNKIEINTKNNANNVQRSGIDLNTQGDISITGPCGKKEPAIDLYKSQKYRDFNQMANILRAELLDGCDKMNYLHPSKIQAEAIPRCLSNTPKLKYPNLIGQAHHGSGKTATFSLIMLQRVDENIHGLQGMVVVHSRELAIQSYNVLKTLGQFIQGVRIGLGVPKEKLPVDWNLQIVVGTPGTIIHRVLDQKRNLKQFLRSFRILVIDEADEFLKAQSNNQRGRSNRGRGRGRGGSQLGTLFDQLKEITTNLQQSSGGPFQTLLFSATYPPSVKKLAIEIAPRPFIIKVAQKKVQLDNIGIFRVDCKDEIDKFNTLLRVISLSNIGQMIIFVNTVNKAKMLVEGLESKDLGIACSALFARGMRPEIRDKTMDQFRKNQTQCLVASNVIARGIDVPAVGLVVNFEVPVNQNPSGGGQQQLAFDSETFMHRVGRTGRFGAKGVCINLIATDDAAGAQRLAAIEKEYSLHIQTVQNSAKVIKQTIGKWLEDE